MKFSWNEDTIRWYQEANNYTGFFNHIAKLIAPSLKGYNTLCDIGCGLGILDLAICQHIDHITCIDISKEAIGALNKCIKNKGITNITTKIMDYHELNKHAQWDVIMISFFGGRHLTDFVPRCKKLLAVLIDTEPASEFAPVKHNTIKKYTLLEAEKDLQKAGINYASTKAVFNFGQPLISIEEAKTFVQSHSPNINPEDLDISIRERLVQTDEDHYPFFLPQQKSIGILYIEGGLT